MFLMLAGTGLYHRLRAAKSTEKISRKEEGLPIMVLLRFFGFSVWIGLLVYMINPGWMAWSSWSLPDWLRWTGAAILMLAIPLIHWMFRSLGRSITDTVAIRKEHHLVMEGPYRYIRHPMYSFSLLAFSGFSLLTANWFIAAAGLMALILLGLRTPTEESKLEARFGEEYRAYALKTGRFLPRITGF